MFDKEIVLLENALKFNNKKLFNKINKADLHNHALLSSNREQFSYFFQDRKLKQFKKSNNINSISKFIKNNLIDITTTRIGQLKLFECSILTAINDGITLLETSVDYRLTHEVYNNNIQDYLNDLISLKNKYQKKILIKYDIGISRNGYKKEHEKTIIKLIKSNVFNGLDIYGDEKAQKIITFKKIYRIAEKNQLILKAHVGEFGTAKDVYYAIKKLHLQVVQHGISIVESQRIMRYAKKKKIVFNVCPISNVKLKRTPKINEHPIKKMFDFGLYITINTDDQLIFENSLFDEYYLLYKNNIFSIEELNKIRLNSLKKTIKSLQ